MCRRYSRQQKEYEVIDGFHVHRVYRGILGPIPFSSYRDRKHALLRRRILGITGKAGFLKTLGKTTYRFYLNSIYQLYVLGYVVRVIRRYHLEVILERETSLGGGTLASIISKKPLVLEINGPEFSSASAKHAKKILAYPKIHQKLLDIGVPRDKLLELFAPVDFNMFKPNPKLRAYMKRKLGLGKAPVVGYVGIFAPWHGIGTLIKASKIILESIPETKFIMVGPYAKDSLERARDIGVSDSFLFTGPVPHSLVPGYINASDVMVAPFNPSESDLTRRKGFPFIPFKVIEYMSCGKPVVSTRSGAIPSIIDDGVNGLLVDPGDKTGLAEAVLKLLNKLSLAKEIGKRAKDSISEKHSWEEYANYMIDIFKEILAD